MEAFGAYSVQMDNDTSFAFPNGFDMEYDERLSFEVIHEKIVIRDDEDFDRMVSNCDKATARLICIKHQPAFMTKTGRVRIPKRFRSLSKSFNAQKMVVWGMEHKILLMDENAFSKILIKNNLSSIDFRNRKILFSNEDASTPLSIYGDDLYSFVSEKQNARANIDLYSTSIFPEEALYCLFSGTSLELYTKETMIRILDTLDVGQREDLGKRIFVIRANKDKKISVPKSLINLIAESDEVLIIETLLGILITNPNVEYPSYDDFSIPAIFDHLESKPITYSLIRSA